MVYGLGRVLSDVEIKELICYSSKYDLDTKTLGSPTDRDRAY
jgi:hypothetical protein